MLALAVPVVAQWWVAVPVQLAVPLQVAASVQYGVAVSGFWLRLLNLDASFLREMTWR
jgi:hypothetical protein